jgi:hypothetical protein
MDKNHGFALPLINVVDISEGGQEKVMAERIFGCVKPVGSVHRDHT